MVTKELAELAEQSPEEVERFERTLAAIPADATTGLEIGFYDLRLTTLFADKVDLVSVDLPREVNRGHEYKLAFANLRALPFGDNAFDIIFCTEVLEHLTDDDLDKALRELQRVSRKYILVTVPYKQLVWNDMFKCSNCQSVSNSMGHLRYLDEESLLKLFKNASRETIDLIGNVEGYAPSWLYKLANRLGNAWSDCIFGECPNCGQTKRAVNPNLLGWFLQRVIWRLVRVAPTRPAWMLMLVRSESGSA